MPLGAKRLYLDTIRERYENAPKRIKREILNEFCAVCGYSRKYAIRILNGQITPRQKKSGPKPKYGAVVTEHLRKVWIASEQLCSKKLVKSMPLWLEFYKCDQEAKGLLLEMSSSTMDRLLKPFRKKRGVSTTQASMFKHRIPIKLLEGDVKEPGFIEADTVAHCGDSAQGPFIYSITMTDLYSGWTENRAVLGKSANSVLSQIKKIEEKLPFTMLGFACDNGTEFINHELEDYLIKRLKPVEFVRRRPYKKNDNAHVEQKNWTHVRKRFGYERFDHPDLVPLMNEIYQAYWNPFMNYYIPTMKLVKKERIGSKVKKTYDEPKTPAQRIIDAPDTPLHIKKKLKEDIKTKNPFYLKEQMDKKLKEFFDLVDKINKGSHNPNSTTDGYLFQ